MKRYIFVRTQFEGFHKWENAPEEVSFLQSLHRHLFQVKLTIAVEHNDREIEFFLVKQWLDKSAIPALIGRLGEKMSCEAIAEQIIEDTKDYLLYQKIEGERKITCEVSEDGENGAVVVTS